MLFKKMCLFICEVYNEYFPIFGYDNVHVKFTLIRDIKFFISTINKI